MLGERELQLIKDTVAKGCDDLQLRLFLHICRKHRLDPLVKQVYCVLWPIDGGKAHEMVVITGINGYRTIAARDHKDFGGTSAAVFTWTTQKTPAGRTIPESATVRAFRKGGEPTEATVYWDEFAPYDLRHKRADFWNRMPKHMLAKVAESQALRKAFPDLADIYTEEEMAQRLQDLTPGGREISIDGVAPSGKILDSRATQAAPLDGNAAHGHAPGSTGAKNAEAALKRVEEADAKLAEKKYRGTVEVDLGIPSDPIVRGDIGNLLELIQKHCKAEWRDSWWHIAPKDVSTIHAMCEQTGYRCVEILPKEQKPHKSTPLPPGVSSVRGTIERCTAGMTQANNPLRNVKINGAWHVCYVNPIFEHLDKGVGQAAELLIEPKRKNIVGLRRIGAKEFDSDGRTPVIQRKDQQAGGKTLF